MADLTQEELDWINSNKNILSGTSLDPVAETETQTEEETVEEPMDPELKAFLERNPDIDITGTSLDPNNRLSPIPGTGQIAVDVTEQTKAVSDQADALTYEGLYGQYPDAPVTSYAINAIDPSDQESADAIGTYTQEVQDWSENANEIYENIGFVENGRRYYMKTVPVGQDENGVAQYETKYFLIPSPEGPTSYSALRALEQAGRDIYQSFGGLLTTGNLLKESDFERNVADFDQKGGEALFTTLLGVAVPAIGAASKAKKYAGKLTASGNLGAKGAITVDATASAMVEAIMAKEGDQGLLVKPERLEGIFGEKAEDVSLFLDGMLLNGGMDTILAVVGRGFAYGGAKVSATKKLANQEILRQAVTDDTMMNVLNYIDPKLVNSSAEEAKRRIYLLSEKLEQGAVINLVLGDATAEITADTSTAMLRAAEAFVREADQNLLKDMTEAEFDEYVANEAARMSTSMINIMRSQMSNPIVQNAANRTQNEIGTFMQDAATQNLPEGMGVDAAAQTTSENLVRNVDNEVADLTNQAADVQRQTDELLRAQATVVEDNPVLMDIVGDTNVFSSDISSYRQAVTDIFTTDVYTAFKQEFDAVDAAYKSLPDAQIDAGLLRDQLATVIRESNVMDTSGRRAATILQDILEPFNPQAVRTADPIPVVGEEGMIRVGEETLDQVLDRVTSEISFQDLYQIKGNMAAVIDRYKDNPAVQQRLIAFRNHITDAENGQIASIAKTQPEVADEYLAADAKFKEAKAKFSNSDAVRALETKLADRRRFDTERGEIPGPFDRNEPDTIIGGQRLADQTVADTTGTLDTQVKYMLEGIKSPEDIDGAFRDLFIAKASEDLRMRLATAGDNAQTEQIIADAFLPYKQQLQDIGATDVITQLETASNQIRDARLNLGDMKLFNEEVLKRIDQEVADAQAGVVSELISDVAGRPRGLDAQGPSKLVTRSDAGTRLEALIKGPDSVNKINELKGAIARLPANQQADALQALQAVALNSIGTRIFGATPTGVNTKNIALGQVNKLTQDEASNLMKSVDALFGASEDQMLMRDMVMDSLNALYESTLPQRIKVSQSGSDTVINAARNSDIQDAASTAILVFAGYMNPTAAMLRRLSSVPIQQANQLQKEVTATTLAVIATDPNTFAKFARAYADGKPTSTLRDIANLGTNSVYRTGREESRIQETEDPRPFDKDMLQLFGIVE